MVATLDFHGLSKGRRWTARLHFAVALALLPMRLGVAKLRRRLLIYQPGTDLR